MTVYEIMTIQIESLKNSLIEFGENALIRGMISGAEMQREALTVEAAECVAL